MQVVAPAGNYQALLAAVKAGADAVYLGMPKFGARAKAENFDIETLRSSIEYAHLFGTKVFVTLNTLIKDSEMGEAIECARTAYACGADAAIVQDVRFIRELKNKLPDLTLHASTQMGVHNADGAKAVLDMGLSRAVLSRETLPQDIREIKKTGIDIEFFVQGALCVCFSGNCYFSSLASSYSGNRGKCMQLCRKKYTLGGKSGYFLSAKDICLYDRLAQLEALGVDAIKIEGRMRSEEYVAQAVRVYKSNMPANDAVEALKAVFNRGDYCTAYLDDGAQFRAVYAKSQANIGRFIGKIDSIAGKKLKINGFLPNNADGFKIMRDGEEVGGATVRGGEIIADCDCRRGDELRRTFDGALSAELKKIDRKIPIDVCVTLAAEEKPTAKVVVNGENVTVNTAGIVQPARTRGITEADVIKAFEKVSEHPFAPKITANIRGEVFLPVSALNELRRACYGEITKKLAARLPVHTQKGAFSLDYNKLNISGTILMVESLDDIDDEIAEKVDYIALDPRKYDDVPGMRADISKPILLNLPAVIRGDDMAIIKRAIDSEFIYGVISNNIGSLKLSDKPVLLGTGHNIIGKCDYPHITSFEADEVTGGFTYVYGRAPVMTLCHCPYGKCRDCDGNDVLTDEKGRRFTLRRYKIGAHCYWQLLNCVPHNLICNSDAKYINKFYDCTGMKRKEILKVINGEFTGEYTRGNMNKGLK